MCVGLAASGNCTGLPSPYQSPVSPSRASRQASTYKGSNKRAELGIGRSIVRRKGEIVARCQGFGMQGSRRPVYPDGANGTVLSHMGQL